MDPASGSPADPRERAASSEPCSARPKPFDDQDISARKRQRTSLSGASRSRSVESLDPSPDQAGPPGDGPPTREGSAMKVDTDPSAPQTPEGRRGTSETPAEPQSSRVTINLRNAQNPLDAIPSSPPTPASGMTVSREGDEGDHDVKASVEEPEADAAPPGPAPRAAASSPPSDPSSPPVEVVDGRLGEDPEFGAAESDVTLVDDLAGGMTDPTEDFPYHMKGEAFTDTVLKLVNFVAHHEDVAPKLRTWLHSYLVWAARADHYALFGSYQRHRSLWLTLPELLYAVVGRKAAAARNPHLLECIGDLYAHFARLAGVFIDMDYRTVCLLAPDETRYPDLASPPYVCAVNLLTRRDDAGYQGGYGQDADDGWDDAAVALSSFQAVHRAQGGTLALLFQLTQRYAELMPRFPRLIEHLGHLSQLVHAILRDLFRALQASGFPQDEVARMRLSSGYQFFGMMSGALSLCLDKYVNHVVPEAASNLVNGLTDILSLSLRLEVAAVVEHLREHRESHPAIPPQQSAEVIANEWRFATFSKMIKSSQMQLRMMAVTQMCQDLVGIWKKHSDAPQDPPSAAVLQLFSDFLTRTGLVAYILGPACHPEITAESGNIVGFLLVTHTYTDEHADLMWQTITTTQDPRVSDALLRMTSKIGNLYPYDALLYLCRKLQTLPVEAFSPSVRELCDVVFRSLPQKGLDRDALDTPPFHLCLRLLRESSRFGPHAQVAFPDIQTFATQKLHELQRHGPGPEGREELYEICLRDLAERNAYTLGSLWMLWLVSRPFLARELQGLTADHDLTRLLVDELESAIARGRAAGFPSVLAGAANAPRRELLSSIMAQQPATITSGLGPRLWGMLVGPGAACRDDRETAWKDLNQLLKGARANPFVQTCLSEYLPTLPPDCFCPGALQFVLEGIRPAVEDPSGTILDDDDSPERAVIEQLWRMVLTAPPDTVEAAATDALVGGIYFQSKSVMSLPHYRARRVHLALVTRCLDQLSAAARRLKAFSDGTAGGGGGGDGDEPMVVVAPEAQVLEQELLFVRSLAVLREFVRMHQATGHFAVPDLRALDLPSPNEVAGESAELRYQSFDGDSQTDIRPLNIGRRNTAGSLLASLREATGFDNYRIYYKGRYFVPQERDICMSLEDLQIQNGLILVKREPDAMPSAERARQGASPVEIEIMAHFDELWEYLSMEEKLANEIYQFLVKLPAARSPLDDDGVPGPLAGPKSHRDVFPLGQPFKSLYAIHALRWHLGYPTGSAAQDAKAKEGSAPPPLLPADVFRGAAALLVSAISDPQVAESCSTPDLQVVLSLELVRTLLSVVRDPRRPESVNDCLTVQLLRRLMGIPPSPLAARPAQSSTELATLSFEAILEACSANQAAWDAFSEDESVGDLIRLVLLDDPRPLVRKQCLRAIEQKLNPPQSPSVLSPTSLCAFLWPVVSSLVEPALQHPTTCEEVFLLAHKVFAALRDASSPALDLEDALATCTRLLLEYTTYEDVTQPDIVDVAAYGLIHLVHAILCSPDHVVPEDMLPARGYAHDLFWKHLFSPVDEDEQPTDAGIIVHSASRAMLMTIVAVLVDQDEAQLTWLFQDLNRLVSYEAADEDDDPYLYDLPQQFERSRAIRPPCGYVGLRNLSNTCYLNSLFTQLFMNVDFRGFMLNVEIRDPGYSQSLLFQTSKLFGNLQNSIRRFVDPYNCVGTIKTYEDTPIDIHNQMDVDEFYNLLFDRWEGQLVSAEAKREFRAFYGGQLVQQVKSKECAHISERLEPFSAIQCDIKGKSTLQESLQAYVDGEIMEGDNKYKCSTCDRHVDAVKRACFKDIPDNLIFHLKRFDFNLRTLQRSKINDYFSFPEQIDMRPYTIEHLSDASADGPEDVFELVGVLVHSGTAESGHYYSYIRERPTTRDPAWVEFNDDMVTPWDPNQMESACFGGPDYRPPYEGNGVLYDKTYSAYMLFYQRASSLQKAQKVLRLSGRPSPLRVDMPEALAENIQYENTSLLRRHCLYDPGHVSFVCHVLDRMRSLAAPGGHGPCSPRHKMEDVAVDMAVSHLDQVASRAKDQPDFANLEGRVEALCRGCTRCSLRLFDYLRARPDVLRMLVQRNPEPVVRQKSAALLVAALEEIKRGEPDYYAGSLRDGDDLSLSDMSVEGDVVHGVAHMFLPLWENFHNQIRSWPEVFGLMLSFVRLGQHETAAFLEHDYLRKVLWIIIADPSIDNPAQYGRMLNAVARRMPTRPPSYDKIISLAEALITTMSLPGGPEGGELLPAHDAETRLEWSVDDVDAPFVFTKPEVQLIFQDLSRTQTNFFAEKLISLNQNHAATDAIVAHIMRCSSQVEIRIYHTLRLSITGQVAAHPVSPFLRVAVLYCRVARRPEHINALAAWVSSQCRNLLNGEGAAFFEFLREVFDGPRENSGDPPLEILKHGLRLLPQWAPALLVYFDPGVSTEVESFLHERLFRYGTRPAFAEANGGAARSEAVVEAARRLGIECLKLLGARFVSRDAHVASNLMASMQRVLHQCGKYFGQGDESEASQALDAEWERCRQEIMEPLQRLIVEDVDDDASEWENSGDASSDQMDSVGDLSMQTIGDANDVET